MNMKAVVKGEKEEGGRGGDEAINESAHKFGRVSASKSKVKSCKFSKRSLPCALVTYCRIVRISFAILRKKEQKLNRGIE